MFRTAVSSVLFVASLTVAAVSAEATEALRVSNIDRGVYVDPRGAVRAGFTQVRLGNAQKIAMRDFRRNAPHAITFSPGSARLSADARRALDEQARWLRRQPHLRFAVSGHADRTVDTRAVEDLGLRRARAAAAYLVSRGVGSDRVFATVSHGADAPLGPPGHGANRRAVTDLIVAARQQASTRKARNGPAAAVQPGSGQNGGATGSGVAGSGDGGGGRPNAGRGNGAEDGDPGNSAGRNQGGDDD